MNKQFESFTFAFDYFPVRIAFKIENKRLVIIALFPLETGQLGAIIESCFSPVLLGITDDGITCISSPHLFYLHC